MDTTQVPPGQKPSPTAVPPSSDTPGLPPGTFEYVDEHKKRNWKRIIEITIVVIIAAIPLTMSLFKPEYSFEKSYAVLNPASYVSGESYQIWGSIITTAKNIIQPETKPSQEENNQTVLLEVTPTNTPTPTTEPEKEPTQAPQEAVYPTLSKEQIEVFTQIEEEPTAYPTKSYIFYPTSPASNQENEEEKYPTATPTTKPTATPTTSSPYAACNGKHKNDKCSYTLPSGNKVEGKCKTAYGGSLICVKD